MCTIIVAFDRWPGTKLLVAANRDERLGRPAEPPAIRTHRGRTILSPRDVEAGGTWVGLNDAGVFVGITNRHDPAYFTRTAPVSRGTLVLDALAASTAADAAAQAAGIDPTRVNPFHLVIGDRTSAHLLIGDGTTLTSRSLEPGVHVVTQSSFGAGDGIRHARLEARLADLADDAPPDWSVWRSELSHHDPAEPLTETCVHMPEAGYGTRSSTYVRLGEDLGDVELLHAEGRPCVTAPQPLTEMLARLAPR